MSIEPITQPLYLPYVHNDRYLIGEDGIVVTALTHVNIVFIHRTTGRPFFKARSQETGNKRTVYVHHAVLETFVGPRPSPRHHALHRDDDKLNNRLDNLYWGTPKQNLQDRARNNPGWSEPKPKLTADQVREIRARDEASTRSLSLEFGVAHSTMRKILNRETWRHVD